MVYPSSRHGIFGQHYTRVQLDFIRRTLGDPKPQKPVSPGEVATGGEEDSARSRGRRRGGQGGVDHGRSEEPLPRPSPAGRGRRIRGLAHGFRLILAAAPRAETAFEAACVDIQRKQDLVDFGHGNLVLQGPLDDVKILTALLEVVDYRVDQRRGLKRPFAEARNPADRARSRMSCPGDARASDVSRNPASARQSRCGWPSRPGHAPLSDFQST